MMQRTTITVYTDDLETLRREAKRRGTSLAELMRDVVGKKAAQLRCGRRPRVGIGRSGGGVSRQSAEDEASPAIGAVAEGK